MLKSVLKSAVVLMLAASPAVSAQTVTFRQEFGPVTVQRVAPGAAPIDFFGLGFVTGDVPLTMNTSDGVTNPLHEANTQTGNNPLYGGRGALIGSIASLSYDFGAVVEGFRGEGIVHRDIAARNFVMQTDFGVYRSLDGVDVLFGVDAPEDYFSGGPVTWVTTDPILLYLNGDEASGDFFQFNGTWFTDTLVPAPGAAGLLGLAGLTAARRRR